MIEKIIARLTGKVAVTVGTSTTYEELPKNAGEEYLAERLRQEIRKNPGATKIDVSDGKKGYSAECW